MAVAAGEGEVLAALPSRPELRADPGAVGERAAALAAAAVEHAGGGRLAGPAAARRTTSRLLLGEHDGKLALSYPAADPAGRPSTRARRSTPSSRRGGSTACARARTCCPATCWRT